MVNPRIAQPVLAFRPMSNQPARIVSLHDVRQAREREAHIRRLAALRDAAGVEKRFEALAQDIETRAKALEIEAEHLADTIRRSHELAARIESQLAMARASVEALNAIGRLAPRERE